MKKRILVCLYAVCFVVFLAGGAVFAQELDTTVTVKDTTAVEGGDMGSGKGSKAAYNAMELVQVIAQKGILGPGKSAVAPDGTIYVIEKEMGRILAFNESGVRLFEIGGFYDPEKVTEEEREKRVFFTDKLEGLTIDEKGNLYVADQGSPFLSVLDSKGRLLYQIPMDKSRQRKAPGRGPSATGINSRGDIYICDPINGVVSVYNMNGQYKYAIHKFKSKQGQELEIVSACDIVINSRDDIYVLDAMIYRIHRFNAKGNYLGSFGGQGSAAGLFVNPTSISIDSKDRIYILDAAQGIVQVFSPTGEFLYALSDSKGHKLDIILAGRINIDKKNDYLYVSQVLAIDGVSVFKYYIPAGTTMGTSGSGGKK